MIDHDALFNIFLLPNRPRSTKALLGEMVFVKALNTVQLVFIMVIESCVRCGLSSACHLCVLSCPHILGRCRFIAHTPGFMLLLGRVVWGGCIGLFSCQQNVHVFCVQVCFAFQNEKKGKKRVRGRVSLLTPCARGNAFVQLKYSASRPFCSSRVHLLNAPV